MRNCYTPTEESGLHISRHKLVLCLFFFFQAEDGIRDYKVTGVQTCALPICRRRAGRRSDNGPEAPRPDPPEAAPVPPARAPVLSPARVSRLAQATWYRGPRPARGRGGHEIGRASCRERV